MSTFQWHLLVTWYLVWRCNPFVNALLDWATWCDHHAFLCHVVDVMQCKTCSQDCGSGSDLLDPYLPEEGRIKNPFIINLFLTKAIIKSNNIELLTLFKPISIINIDRNFLKTEFYKVGFFLEVRIRLISARIRNYGF